MSKQQQRSFKWTAIIFAFCCCLSLLLFSSVNLSASTLDNKVYTGVGTIDVNEYSREGSRIEITNPITSITDIAICNDPNVTCINFVAGDAKASFACHGGGINNSNNGWWGDVSYSGQCWQSLEAYYFYGTPSQTPIDMTSDGRDNPSHPGNAVNVVPTTSSCSPPAAKGICQYEGSGIKTNTGDDMFALSLGASGYVEYPALSSTLTGDPNRLIYISRSGGLAKDLMLPSGPLSGANAYSDYRRFIDSPPTAGGLSIETDYGCYPISVGNIDNLCRADFPTTPPAPINGMCGGANGNSYNDANAVNTAGLCSTGEANPSSVAGNGPWAWSCDGLYGGTSATCGATQSIAGVCKVVADYQATEPSTSATACDYGVYANSPADTTTQYRWTCNGINGGAPSPTCSALKPTTEAGTCKAIPGSYALEPATNDANACNSGTYTDLSDTATKWQWRCDGTGTPPGANSPTCQADRTPACANGPTGSDENGTCGSANGGTYATTAEVNAAQRCLTGSPTASTLAGTTFSWSCNGVGTGTAQACNANFDACSTVPNETGSCVAKGYTVQVGYQRTAACATDGDYTSPGYTASVGSPGICSQTNNLGSCPSYYLERLYKKPGCGTAESEGSTPIAGICKPIAGYSSTEPATSTANACNEGTFTNLADTASKWQWRCDGTNGGANSPTCQADRATTVNGSCNNATQNACASGASNDAAVADTTTEWRWRCDGTGTPTGTNSGTCSKAKPITTVNGACKAVANYQNPKPATTSANACNAGTFVNLADTGTQWKWRCNGGGSPAGTNSPTCTSLRPTTVNGACNNATRNACTSGSANDGAVADTGTEWRWRCDGTGSPVGSNSGTCSKTIPITGVCKPISGTYTSEPATTTANACNEGTFTNLADTASKWQWRCDGIAGGGNSPTCQADRGPPPGSCNDSGTTRLHGSQFRSHNTMCGNGEFTFGHYYCCNGTIGKYDDEICGNAQSPWGGC